MSLIFLLINIYSYIKINNNIINNVNIIFHFINCIKEKYYFNKKFFKHN